MDSVADSCEIFLPVDRGITESGESKKMRQFLNKKKSFSIEDGRALQDSLAFIEETLREIGLGNKLTLRTLLLAEELIPQLLRYASDGARLRVRVRRYLGDISVSIYAAGESFDPYTAPGDDSAGIEEMGDEEAEQAIRGILLKSQGDKLKISHKNGVNRIRILAGRSNQQMVIYTTAAVLMGLLCGLLMKFVFPAGLSDGLETYLLSPIRTMFMNALRIVIGPVIFFSIVSCISQFKDLSELGRIGIKIMGTYLMTTVIAIALSYGISMVLQPGTFGFALEMGMNMEAAGVDLNVDTSLLHTIVNIVPSNLFSPFLESNTLQIIFLAVLCGTAVGLIGDHTAILQEFFEACNALFLTITTLLARLIPLVVFCSVAMMLANRGGATLLPIFGFVGVILIAIFCMILIYGLLVLILGRLNPIIFFKKNREGMLTSLTLSSSSAAMPTNIRICTDLLGISPRVCSFSIPLGATVNMDGTCILLTIAGLFLARAYGVAVLPSAMVSLAITIVLLSLGCPGVPGAGIVCLGIVLTNLGVPVEAIGLIMAVNPFIDMVVTMSNTTGDVAASLIVARSEGLVDLEVYKSE